MFIFAFPFIQNFFAAQETPDWKETIVNIYRDNYFQSCDIKKQIEILASLQLFNICAYDESHNLNRSPNIIVGNAYLKEKREKVRRITHLIFASTFEMFYEISDILEPGNTANFISSVISNVLKKYFDILTENNIFVPLLYSRVLDKNVFDRLTKIFNFPVKLMNGTVDLKTIYDALKIIVNKIDAPNRLIEHLNERLDTLKFLTEREYGTKEDLKKLLIAIENVEDD